MKTKTPDEKSETDIDIQPVLQSLLGLSPTFITYEQVENALIAAGLDPYKCEEIYAELLEQLEQQGRRIGQVEFDGYEPISENVEELSRRDADEVERLLAKILDRRPSSPYDLLTAPEERRLLEIYIDGVRASTEINLAISDEHEFQIGRRIAAGKRALDELIEKNIRLVAKLAIKSCYGLRSLEVEDLIQEGAIGLGRAIERFDLDTNTRLSTYATWWIRQAISRATADLDRTIRLPVHMVEEVHRILRIEAQLLRELGREPTSEEIALEAGLLDPSDREAIRRNWSRGVTLMPEIQRRLERGARRVRTLQQYGRGEPVSLDLPVGDDDNSLLGDFVPDMQNDPAKLAEQEDLRKILRSLLKELSEREALVLNERFGLEDGISRTLEEIGSQLSVTRERVRQIEAKALRKLRHPLRSRKVRDFME